MQAFWRWLADGVAAVHLGYLGYLATGGFIASRWPRTIVAHVIAAGWGAVIVTTDAPCPLTALQNNLRERAGQDPLSASYIDTYVRGRLFPADRLGVVQGIVAVLVLVSWVGFGARTRRHTPSATA
jgi:Protein of Unknown function (DUF2784)